MSRSGGWGGTVPDKVRLGRESELGHWLEGQPVTAAWSDTVIGTILSTGEDDDGFFALVELTPEARGISIPAGFSHVPEETDVQPGADDHPFG